MLTGQLTGEQRKRGVDEVAGWEMLELLSMSEDDRTAALMTGEEQ